MKKKKGGDIVQLVTKHTFNIVSVVPGVVPFAVFNVYPLAHRLVYLICLFVCVEA